MRAENPRSKATRALPAFEQACAPFMLSAPSRVRAWHLRLVPLHSAKAVQNERGTAVRLAIGFSAIVGFVTVGLWVEFRALERAAYLVSSLGFFSLYGAATWVRDAAGRSRSAEARGR